MFKGKTQLTRIWTVKPDGVEKMKENAESHTNWMKETHYKEGEKALLMLNWCMESEKDEKGNETGNTLFVLKLFFATFRHHCGARNSRRDHSNRLGDI